MRILAIGAHPDDIEIACSGTLAKCVQRGDTVIVCHVSSGNLGHVVIPPDELRVIRANEAKKAGAKTSIDLVSENSDRYSLVVPCLKYVDNLIINEVEAGKICGMEASKENLPEIAKTLKGMGVRERVIIHTPDLGICYSDNGITITPSYQLPEGYIQGTTGAGDAYCAGALLGIHEELSDMDILNMATVAATGALSTADATSGLKTYEELKEICKDFKRK